MAKAMNAAQEAIDEDGLTAVEREHLTTPFSQLSEQQRIAAIHIHGKMTANRYVANEKYRREQEAAKPKLK